MSDHLNYYKKIKSIPTVNLDDLSLNILFKQIENFYFCLGITKQNFYKKSILELCAGTGLNAYFLKKSFKIKKMKLLDKNPESLRLINKNLSKYKNIKIINKNLNKFSSAEKFDYVILQNGLDNFKNEKKIINKLINFTLKKGNIILTIGENFGALSMKLRYIFSLILIEQSKFENFNSKLFFLSKIFKTHLNYLSKYTRDEKKWILDNILNEEWIKKKNYIDYPKLIKLIHTKAIIQKIHPSYHENYSWYKSINLKKINKEYLDTYKNKKLNFLDFETKFEKKTNIDKNIKTINNLISNIKIYKKINKEKIILLKREIKEISYKLNNLNKHNKISLALNEFRKILENFLKNKKINPNTKYFKKFWGSYTHNVLLYKL